MPDPNLSGPLSLDASAPAVDCAAVTPSDSTDFTAGIARSLYVGGAGNVVIVTPDGDAITFTAVPAGSILPVYCKRVNSTSTTATSIVALF